MKSYYHNFTHWLKLGLLLFLFLGITSVTLYAGAIVVGVLCLIAMIAWLVIMVKDEPYKIELSPDHFELCFLGRKDLYAFRDICELYMADFPGSEDGPPTNSIVVITKHCSLLNILLSHRSELFNELWSRYQAVQPTSMQTDAPPCRNYRCGFDGHTDHDFTLTVPGQNVWPAYLPKSKARRVAMAGGLLIVVAVVLHVLAARAGFGFSILIPLLTILRVVGFFTVMVSPIFSQRHPALRFVAGITLFLASIFLAQALGYILWMLTSQFTP